MRNKILLLESIHKDALEMLGEVGEIITPERPDDDHLRDSIGSASAVITRGVGRLPRALLSAGRNLRCVARCGVGTDNIDVGAATELGIPVIYAPGSTTVTVAEHALMLMLTVARRVTLLNKEVKEGNWSVRGRIGLGMELGGKTLGILGLGDIGRRVAELGNAFGMSVVYWSRGSRDERFEYVDRDELLRRSDVLSIHLALSPETRQMIGEESLALMKPTAILINTARGEVLDESALCEALYHNRLAGAGLDVIGADSPHEKNPLWALDNVVITPHVAAVTDVAFRKMCVETSAQVVRILRGDRPDPRFVRNPSVL